MEIVAEKRVVTAAEVDRLNLKYRKLDLHERIEELYNDFNLAEVMLTSSFAATSAFLLKLFSDVNRDQLVYFIDTGYHFEETLEYRQKLTDLYGLKVKSVSALKEEHEFTQKDKTWEKDPDFCCHINKVKPLDLVKAKYTVWVSGLMEWQSEHRASLNIFENRGDILKFYPLLDVTKEERDEFIKKHQLPFHPLVKKGYHSIGCSHCTSPGVERSGRWNNNPKTECGLHL
ncbi:phosphoadenylyl-sulfate reductase [Salinimicrobium sp. MT39]|uniref:Adenosine 5'-phosphosulfate reductase n=1 Tax=Salinimicrobium profundisediminis TaxID=2994553 RepID=A0A9X3I1E8_9FLAO|nr:phosphoadenylyl-sulfate reductase [Salinimicrobium profundisediminis]MCX2839000.1 phosphoadenylyl-sulfate reductase [Salinimicrobium profundisediminis]